MTTRNLITNTVQCKSLEPESLVLKNGTVEGSNGLLIDGTLTKMHIVSKDGSLIHISATAKLESCTIEGKDILLEGNVDAVITAQGDCEIGASAVMVGTLNVGGDLFKSRLADVTDLHVTTLKSAIGSAEHDFQRAA